MRRFKELFCRSLPPQTSRWGRLDPWEIWELRLPRTGFGTERARLGTIKKISKNVVFYSKRSKTSSKPEVLLETLKTIIPPVILIFFYDSQVHQIFKPIRLFFRNYGMISQVYINMIFNIYNFEEI